MLVQTISSEPRNILLPNLVCLCSIMSQSVMQKNWFTVFNVKVTARAYLFKIWLFLLYLLNCWSICNQLGLIVQHHKLERPVEKWDFCIQGQGHSKGSKCQWMFVRMIFSKSQIILLPNLVWYHEPEACGNYVVVAIFKVKVTARAFMIKIRPFLLYYLNCWFLGNQTWSDDTSSEARVSCEKKKDYCSIRVKVYRQ